MAEPHTTSYYAATANAETRYPRLEGPAKADVCVIGAGFSGLNTAINLAERGYKVVVLEAQRVGWGASGRNGGQSSADRAANTASKPSSARRARSSCATSAIAATRSSRAASPSTASSATKAPAGWRLPHAPKHMAHLRDYYEAVAKEDHGDQVRHLRAGALRQVLGTGVYHGGVIDRRSGHLHPLNLCLGEALAAAKLGVKIFEDSPVLDFAGGAKPFALTAHGRVEANSIVVAV